MTTDHADNLAGSAGSEAAHDGPWAGRRPRVAVVVSAYNAWITDRLAEGAREAYGRLVGPDAAREGAAAGEAGLTVHAVPGSFELAAGCRMAAGAGLYDAVVALGCVIKGETEHDRFINQAVATELARLGGEVGEHGGGCAAGTCGRITANTAEQAEARAGGAHGNKGAEAMEAALEMIKLRDRLREGARAAFERAIAEAQREALHGE